MARKIKAKLIMELRDQGVSRRSIAIITIGQSRNYGVKETDQQRLSVLDEPGVEGDNIRCRLSPPSEFPRYPHTMLTKDVLPNPHSPLSPMTNDLSVLRRLMLSASAAAFAERP